MHLMAMVLQVCRPLNPERPDLASVGKDFSSTLCLLLVPGSREHWPFCRRWQLGRATPGLIFRAKSGPLRRLNQACLEPG